MQLDPPCARNTLKEHLQTPVLPITIQASPPGTALHLQLNGLFVHELTLKGRMLALKSRQQVHEPVPLVGSELDSPAFTADQDGKLRAGWIMDQAPTWPFLLDHPGRRSG